MEVRYKCKCQEKEQAILVTDRVKHTDILPWMELVQASIGYHHRMTSPLCRKEEMEYCMIPADNEERIGVPITKN